MRAASEIAIKTGEVFSFSFGHNTAAVALWYAALSRLTRCIYKSVPLGCSLQKRLLGERLCAIGTVSKILRQLNNRVNSCRRDATFLVVMLVMDNAARLRCARQTPYRGRGSPR